MPGRVERLGQHFLGSAQLAARIVADARIGSGDRVVDLGRTAAILGRLLDDPAGGLVRADLVVQWQVARHRARVDAAPPMDLLGATWAPWWRFTRGRRLPAACFRPRPAVDAAVLRITRLDPPGLPATEFGRYAAWLRREFGSRPEAREIAAGEWVERFRSRRPRLPGLHSKPSSANMI